MALYHVYKWSGAIVLAGCCFIASTNRLVSTNRVGFGADAIAQTAVVKSTDSRSQVKLPAGWVAMPDLHEEADLEIGNAKESAYLIVLSEAKIDFSEQITYREHAQITLKQLVENTTNAKVVRGPTELMVSGRPAIQYEVQGEVDNFRYIYFHTTIDGRKSFHQLIAWTPPSRLTSNRKVLETVINSFTEVE